jgi:hypothetical protein
VLVPDDLQVVQAREQRRYQEQDDDSSRQYAPAEQALLGPVVLESNGSRHD